MHRLFDHFHRIAHAAFSRPPHQPFVPGPNTIGALLDAGTSTLFTVTGRPSVLRALNELVPGSVYVRSIHYGRKPEARALADGDPKEYPRWQWAEKSGSFVRAREEPSEILRARAALAHAQRDALVLLTERVNGLRLAPATMIQEQGVVYLDKRDQALAFKAAGYDAAKLPEYPYVEQYAAIAERTPRQAADEIIFQARLRDDVLQKSETVRLKFMAKIRDARSAAELENFKDELDELTMQVLK